MAGNAVIGALRVILGADHRLSDESCRQAYNSILTGWATEMILGARTG